MSYRVGADGFCFDICPAGAIDREGLLDLGNGQKLYPVAGGGWREQDTGYRCPVWSYEEQRQIG